MSADSRRAMILTSTDAISSRLCLKNSRRHRFTLLRTTAQPIFLLAVIPNRAICMSFSRHTTRKPRTADLCCAEASWRNSARFRKRALLGKVAIGTTFTPVKIYLTAILTARFLRPFALLRLITKRPFLVAILTRNPWVRLREILLGWYVLFILILPLQKYFSGNGLLNIPPCICQVLYYPQRIPVPLICLEKGGRLCYSPAPSARLTLYIICLNMLYLLLLKVFHSC